MLHNLLLFLERTLDNTEQLINQKLFTLESLFMFIKILIITTLYFGVIFAGILIVIKKYQMEKPCLYRLFIILILSMVGQLGVVLMMIWPYSLYFKLCLNPVIWLTNFCAITACIRHEYRHFMGLFIIFVALIVKLISHGLFRIPLI